MNEQISNVTSATFAEERLWVFCGLHAQSAEIFLDYISSDLDVATIHYNSLSELLSAKVKDSEKTVVILDPLIALTPETKAVEKIRGKLKMSKIVIYLSESPRTKIDNLVRTGVNGFLMRDAGYKSFIASMEYIEAGELLIPSKLILPDAKNDFDLTQTEVELLRLAKDGLKGKEVARELGLSESQVKTKYRSVFKKMTAKNRTHAISIAKASGLI